MNKIYKILVLGLVLSAIIQTASASDQKDYTCVDKETTKSPPQTLAKIDKDIGIPLCSDGKVPQAINSNTIPDITIKEPSGQETASCSYGICYDWAISRQHVDNKGIFALISQHNPEIDPVNGIYSLAGEVVIGNTNRVEFGWRKAKGGVPRLVTTWWKNGVKKCDNAGCGWVQTSNMYYPGMAISTDGSTKLYEIEYMNGDWWIYYNGEYLGYYPGSLWNGQFVQATDIVYRGGVVSKVPVTTTDMGNGLLASNPNAAIIDEQEYLGVDTTGWSIAHTDKWATSPNLYSVVAINYKSMRYGGPGGTTGIIVVSPNGGENWAKGTTKTIKWNSIGNTGAYVKIELWKGGILHHVISPSTPNDGSYDWAIPSTQVLGNNYKIRIISTSKPYKDISDNNFIISSSAPRITVVSPNGGENWERTSTHTITWTKTGNTGAYVKIELWKGGVLHHVISPSTPNDGSYSWVVSSDRLGTDFKVKITSTSSPAYTDLSNNYFSIVVFFNHG